MRKRLLVVGAGVCVSLVVPLVLLWSREPVTTSDEMRGGNKLPPGLARKFAKAATFSPAGSASLLEDRAGGSGAQDWLEHATPGDDIPFSALRGRGTTGGA